MSDFNIASKVVREMLIPLDHLDGSVEVKVKAAKAVFVKANEEHGFNEMTRRAILDRFWRAAGLIFKELQ